MANTDSRPAPLNDGPNISGPGHSFSPNARNMVTPPPTQECITHPSRCSAQKEANNPSPAPSQTLAEAVGSLLLDRRTTALMQEDIITANRLNAKPPACDQPIWIRYPSDTEIVIGTKIRATDGPAVTNYLSSIITRLTGKYSLEFLGLEKNVNGATFFIKARVNKIKSP